MLNHFFKLLLLLKVSRLVLVELGQLLEVLLVQWVVDLVEVVLQASWGAVRSRDGPLAGFADGLEEIKGAVNKR